MNRAVVRRAVREALGAPSLVLGASYVGFGSLVRESGLGLFFGLFSTATGWALPGQVVLVELMAAGASVFVIVLAVALTNVRLLPMTVALMPQLRHPAVPRWRYYLYAHLIAVTGWAQAMRNCPSMPVEDRVPYFVAFSGTLWVTSMTGTAIGFLLAGSVPDAMTLGLVFLNPIYFMLVFAADLRSRARALALLLGALLGPALHIASPDWGLLATGLLAGTAAFAADRMLGGRRG